MGQRIKNIALILIVIIGLWPVTVQAESQAKFYKPISYVTGISPSIELRLHEDDISLDSSKRKAQLRMAMDASTLITTRQFPQSYKLEVYVYASDGSKLTVSIITPTLVNNKQATNSSFQVPLNNFNESQDLYFDLYNASGILINTYKVAINIDNFTTASTSLTGLEGSNCVGNFGACQLEYLFDNVKFEAVPRETPSTTVSQNPDGTYTVALPMMKVRERAGRKIAKKKKIGFKIQSIEGELVPALNIGESETSLSTIFFDQASQQLNFSFNDQESSTVIFDAFGKVGIGVENPLAFLDVRGGDGVIPSIRINPGTLTASVIDGALEYDGNHLYFTANGTREELALGDGAQGPVGPRGPAGATGATGAAGATGATGTQGASGSFNGGSATINGILSFVNGARLQAPKFNGTALFRNNSIAQFNGTVLIKSGTPGVGKVLTSDATGNATWTALAGGGDMVAANNLSDVVSASTARTNLGLAIGTDVQAYDADLTTWGSKAIPSGTVVGTSDAQTLTNKTLQAPNFNGTALFLTNSTAKFNGSILIPASAGSNKVLTSDASGNATWQTISGSNVTGVLLAANNLSDVTASTARTNLGLVIGTNVEAWDADLDTWATKTAPSGTVVGTSDTQTLTNKTLTSPTITGATLTSSSLSSANLLTPSLNGAVSFVNASSWLQAPNFNGTALFLTNSTAKFNGSILIPASAGSNKVLTSDASGNATWQTISGSNVTGVLLAANNLSDVTAATARTNLGLAIGTNVQAYDADLTTWGAKAVPTGTVVGDTDTQTLTNKTLQAGLINGTTLFKNNSAAQFNGTVLIKSGTPGVGKVLTSDATGNATWTALAGGGDMVAANNLSDVASVSTARANLDLEPGVDVQAYDADLTTWGAKAVPTGTVVGTSDTQTLTNKTLTSPTITGASLTSSSLTSPNLLTPSLNGAVSFVNASSWLQAPKFNGTSLFLTNSTAKFNGSILIPASAGANKVLTSDGSGNATWQTISGSNVTGVLLAANNLSDVTAATARTNLGLAIGTNVQAYNSKLASIAGFTVTNGDLITSVNGSLAKLARGTDHYALKVNGANLVWEADATGGGGGGTPGGADTEIQFNSSGSFGASSSLTWDGSIFKTPSILMNNGTAANPSIAFKNNDGYGIYKNTAGKMVFVGGGSNEALFIGDGQVGIGAVSPGARLYVSQDLRVEEGAFLNNGTVSYPAYSFTTDTDTGIFKPAADTLAITTGGTERVRIKSDGNVGIGTTSIDTALEVNGTVMINLVVNKAFYSNTSGANVTIDWNNGNKQKITLGHNVTFAFTDPTAGVGSFTLRLTQDGTGSRTVTWPASVKWPGGTAPTLSTAPAYIDMVTCVYDIGPVYYCQIGLDFR